MTVVIMKVAVQQNSKKYCHKSIGIGTGNTLQKQYSYWYQQYFLPKYCYWYWQ